MTHKGFVTPRTRWYGTARIWTLVVGALLLVPTWSAGSDEDLRGSHAFCDPGILSNPSLGVENNIAGFTTVLNTDYVSAGVGGMRNIGSATITLAGVSGTINRAYLYWHGPTNSSNPAANASVFVNGSPVVGTNIGFSNDNCWGFANSQAYRADVTSLVQATGNGAYSLTGFGSGAINTNGASLLVFFNDGTAANNRDIVIFDGNDSNIPNSFDANGWNVSLSGITVGAPLPPASASIEMHVADGQSFIDDALILNATTLVPTGGIFNGVSVPSANSGPTGNGSLWDIRSFDVTSYLSVGPNTLTLTTGVASDCLALVVAVINLPAGTAPCQLVCSAGGPYSADCNLGSTTSINLDGTGSSNPDSLAINYSWTSDCPAATFDNASSATPVLTVPTPVLGNIDCTVTLTVSVSGGPTCGSATSTCTTPLHIECSNRPPDCTGAVASEATLWPPNHKYHAISVLGVTDPDGDPVTITVTGITQDEPLNTRGDGNTCPDGQIVDGQASVRAERTGTPGIPGNGRVYVISFTADDGKGGSCNGTVSVCVPHDQGAHSTCIDDGQKYNSLGPCNGGLNLSQEVTDYGLTVGEASGTQATIEFALPKDANVQVAVFDVSGRRLATLEDGPLATGVYQRTWNLSSVAKGLYFVRLRAGAVTLSKTVVKTR